MKLQKDNGEEIEVNGAFNKKYIASYIANYVGAYNVYTDNMDETQSVKELLLFFMADVLSTVDGLDEDESCIDELHEMVNEEFEENIDEIQDFAHDVIERESPLLNTFAIMSDSFDYDRDDEERMMQDEKG